MNRNIRAVKYNPFQYYPITNIKQDFFDKINIELGQKFIDNFSFITKEKNLKRSNLNEQLKKIRNIVYNCKNDLPHRYKFAFTDTKTKDSIGFEHGRVYCDDSLQSLKRCFRHSLASEDSRDLDIYSCHIAILYQYAIKLKLKVPVLKSYYYNRENYLKKLMDDYYLSKGDAKEIALSVINFGKRSHLYPTHKWIENLENEVLSIYKKLENSLIGKRIVKHVKSTKRQDKNGNYLHDDGRRVTFEGTVLNLFLCKTEGEILCQCINFLKENNIPVRTLCFDGLIGSDKISDDILLMLTDYVYDKLGLTMYFVIKPFDEKFDEEFLLKLDIEDNLRKARELIRDELDFTQPDISTYKCCMAHGKTTMNLKYFETLNSDVSILYLTPRIALADELQVKTKNLGFKYYKDLKKDEFKNAHRLICQINSLPKVDRYFDIIVLDEIETHCSTIVEFGQLKKKCDILFQIQDLIENCKQCFIMDANLEEDTENIFKERFPEKKFTSYKSDFKPFKNKHYFIAKGNNCEYIKKCHLNCVFDKLYKNMKVSIPIGSTDYLEDIYLSIKNKFPDKKILRVSANYHFSTVDDFKEYDVVIYTTTLCCGNSFDEEHFDYIIPYINNIVGTGKQYSQQILRVRKFKYDLIIFAYMENSHKKLLTKQSLLYRWKKNAEFRESNGIVYSSAGDKFNEDFSFKIFQMKILESENKTLNLIQDIKTIFDDHGFELKDNPLLLNTNLIIDTENKINNFIKFSKTMEAEAVINSEDKTKNDFEYGKCTSREGKKYMIKKTFNLELSKNEKQEDPNIIHLQDIADVDEEEEEKVPYKNFEKNYIKPDKLVEFIAEFKDKDKLKNHNNLYRLSKYGPDALLKYYDIKNKLNKNDMANYCPTKNLMDNNFLFTKALEFIKKYKILEIINIKQGFKINFEEFIKWFNERDENQKFIKLPFIDKGSKGAAAIIKQMLKLFGLKLTRSTKRINDTIETLIDYNKYNITFSNCVNYSLFHDLFSKHNGFIYEMNKYIIDDEFEDLNNFNEFYYLDLKHPDINNLSFNNHNSFSEITDKFYYYMMKDNLANTNNKRHDFILYNK